MDVLPARAGKKSTGEGFTFSSPYYYDGMAYMGSERLVGCAEEQKRYDECSDLLICVSSGTTAQDFVQSFFPSDFFVEVSWNSADELSRMMNNSTCNVWANDRTSLLQIASSDVFCNQNVTVGREMVTKEPLAIVTRDDDAEFSNAVNWVLQALFYGEEQGLTRNASLCGNAANSTFSPESRMNYLNAVYCVGNYREIYESALLTLSQVLKCKTFDQYKTEEERGMNQINTGTTGMLYATPFGNLQQDNLGNSDNSLEAVRKNGTFVCGVVTPDDFVGDVETSTGQVGLSVDYCRVLSAALFNGNAGALSFHNFTGQEDAVAALNEGIVTVLTGARIEKNYNFGSPPLVPGIQYSTPYYYGNETAR